MGLTYTITLFRLNWQISELPSCLLELPGECEVRFALQWGTLKAIWKEWVSNTLLHFSDWIDRFLSFLLQFWNYQMNVKSALHCSEELRRLSEKNGYQIHYYTFQTEMLDFWASFLLLELTNECEVRFALQWETLNALWKKLKSTLQCSEKLWRLSEKNESQILYFTFQTELLDFWVSFLPFIITSWMWSPLCIAGGTLMAIWKKCVSHTILHFSDWISKFLRFLLAFWNYLMNVKSALHCSEELWRLSEKNASHIQYHTFQTELADFWASFLPFGFIRWC